MNLASVLKQAQQVQKKLQDAQKDLADTIITAEVANGAVTASVDGHGKFKSIKIKPEAINPENPASVDMDMVEMLEDMISKAMNQATENAGKKMQDKMKGVVPAGLNIPGLF